MRPGSDAQTPSVFEVVRRAVAVCDPDGDDERSAELLLAYEDRDEPVTALGDRDRTFFETAERIAGALPAPGLELAAAVATYSPSAATRSPTTRTCCAWPHARSTATTCRRTSPRGWRTPASPSEAGGRQVLRYSGPSPPSGVVRRPPLAVIAPHCTQLV
jgi:hypothetical protein